ncbi:unnamed protein product, partial [Musa acuminata var. zebrina]
MNLYHGYKDEGISLPHKCSTFQVKEDVNHRNIVGHTMQMPDAYQKGEGTSTCNSADII